MIGDRMKKILVTGARSGIANAVIDELIHKKYYIYVTVHTDKQLQIVERKYEGFENVECLKIDITNVLDREKLETLDIDILLNNAAIGYGGSIAEIPMSKVRKNFETNVFSYFEVEQIVLKNMIKKNRGKVINMASLAGIIPICFLGSYCATKASIIKMTECLKKELKVIDSKVDICLIEPGLYHTGFNQVMLENKYKWMDIDSYFSYCIDFIRAKEDFVFKMLEKHELKSIVKKIIKAIKSKHPNFIYRAPLSQVVIAKGYQIFRS